jgi:NAD(P)-dependent dehydrogenase (short-subunit alcohol dehydrogenase family)
MPAAMIDDRRQNRAIKRYQQAEDVVGAIAFLASPDSDFMTGQVVNVDGGAIMY